MSELTQQRLKELLVLDEETGVLYWRTGGTGRKPSRMAGHFNRFKGRWHIEIDGRNYLRSRVNFLYVHGWLPVEVDHKDRDKTNDRPGNLRPATQSQNQGNRGAHRSKRSGLPKGVHFSKDHPQTPFRASICVNGRSKHLGYFSGPGLAHAAYVEAAEQYFGEFACAV